MNQCGSCCRLVGRSLLVLRSLHQFHSDETLTVTSSPYCFYLHKDQGKDLNASNNSDMLEPKNLESSSLGISWIETVHLKIILI
ncbi:hypothetical protein F0562_007270 [Nyssa sinensis]|uniref:Uncharacterized protein n=1 Tax=Nyssa sinensis TaxID=561372 RepID=A0A5J5A6D9_9ASTE|nr:hypothetical protein F0562_007270 [Nyssa sinensis]